VRIRFHFAIDGRAADAAWNDGVNGLFAFRDRDGDGLLDASERTPFAQPARDRRELLIDGPVGVQPLRLTFNQKDEKVTRAAFAEAVRASGMTGIGLRVVPSRADSRQLSDALFRHLDQSGDGRLSPDELKAGRERLTVLDADEDELVTAAELLGRVATNAGPVRVFPGMRTPEPAAESTELIFLTADGAQAVKQLLAARGGARATSLKPNEFGGDGKKFAALDQDGNKVLDSTELTAWVRQPPDLELAVAFDAATGQLIVLAPAAPPAGKNGGVAAALPGGRFEFEPPAGAPVKQWEQAATALREQFKELAKEAGTVERKQLENQPPALAFFDFADRNGDGKLSADEIDAALKALAPLARCRIDVAFVDRGNGLFELFDRNGDDRLSLRELVDSVAVLKPFAGSDGSVGPKDLVRQFQVRFAIDPIPVGVLIQPGRPVRGDDSVRPANAPAWFAKMDRNGDGDVSLREFVGPIELFRRLDRNGDGLVSADEATAVKE
jgi:Ca2+-binding EF-hand superfamily protein